MSTRDTDKNTENTEQSVFCIRSSHPYTIDIENMLSRGAAAFHNKSLKKQKREGTLLPLVE